MDLGRSPARVLMRQAPDQYTNLFANLRSAAARPRAPPPVKPETSAVPADDGRGFDDDEDVSPTGPTMAQGIPKESVQPVQGWTRPLAFEHRDLLSEGQDFESRITPTAKENPERRKECEDRVDHELTLLTWRNVGFSQAGDRESQVLALQLDAVLSTDRGAVPLGRIRILSTNPAATTRRWQV